jgi:hypothetical protein
MLLTTSLMYRLQQTIMKGFILGCAGEPLNSVGAFQAGATGILPLRSGSVEEFLPSSRSRIIVGKRAGEDSLRSQEDVPLRD